MSSFLFCFWPFPQSGSCLELFFPCAFPVTRDERLMEVILQVAKGGHLRKYRDVLQEVLANFFSVNRMARNRCAFGARPSSLCLFAHLAHSRPLPLSFFLLTSYSDHLLGLFFFDLLCVSVVYNVFLSFLLLISMFLSSSCCY